LVVGAALGQIHAADLRSRFMKMRGWWGGNETSGFAIST
jgi:hypothetical protein